MAYAIALFDFEGEEENELGFTKGAKIIITQTYDDSDWTAGYLDGDPNKSQGLFPTNYVEFHNKEKIETNTEKNESKSPVQEEINNTQKKAKKENPKQTLSSEKSSSSLENKPLQSYEILDNFKWKTEKQPPSLEIVKVHEKGLISKTQHFEIKMDNSNVKTLTWEDILWLRSIYTKHYPNVCTSPLLDLKPTSRKHFSTILKCRKLTTQQFLYRITEHPLLSQTDVIPTLFNTSDKKSFKKAKKEIEKKSQIFWKTVHHNFPVPDTKLSQQIDLFRKNLIEHSKSINNIYHQHKFLSIDKYNELYKQLQSLSEIYNHWSAIPFDWRNEIPENCPQINEPLKKSLTAMSQVFKEISNSYLEHGKSEMDLLELFLLEYEQMYSCFKKPFNERDRSQLYYHEKEQQQLNFEKKTIVSEKDNEKIEKLRKNTTESKKRADTITYITLVESEYFRKTRIRDTKQKLGSYIDLQIDLFQDFVKKFTEVKNVISNIPIEFDNKIN
ncbi:sorting nexin [Anaeramoeba flamelloides]|uniref:Sorting nexin n=1 Tax=Anaeramoeba flamelloides TaxID=1746091 RepID=A0AAV7ZUT7_9EUKA|nr:sorting nexin [Anaeramoeba flamelloides]